MSEFVSIIIPVYNNNYQLKLCLNALQNQTYPYDFYQIIVVDNGSDIEVKKELELLIKEFKNVILTEENKPSSYGARNKGIKLAKGNILAFTDSDCIPTEKWLEKGVEMLLNNPQCGLVGGKMETFSQSILDPNFIEVYEIFIAFPQEKYIKEDNFSVTAKLFTFRKIFDEIGVFDNTLQSGGDFEWGNRVFHGGYKLLYCQDALIKHPARKNITELKEKYKRMTSVIYILSERKNTNIINFLNGLIKNLFPPLEFFINLFNNRKFSIKQKFIVIYIKFCVNYFVIFETIRLKLGGKLYSR